MLVGPILNFQKFFNNNYVYTVLCIYKDENIPSLLYLYDDLNNSIVANINYIIKLYDTVLYIYEISLEFNLSNKCIYYFDNEPDIKYSFNIPYRNNELFFIQYSCNLKSYDMIENWKTILNDHNILQKHFMIGCGNQIYCDDVFNILSINNLFNNNDNFNDLICSSELEKEIDKFYFNNYINYLTTPYYKSIISLVPSINNWNDREIFDNYGSYSDEILNCSIIKKMFEISKKYYLLFQHHSVNTESFFHENNLSKFVKINKNTTLFLLDHLSERTKTQIISKKSKEIYDELMTKCSKKNKNVLMVIGSPITFPNSQIVDEIKKLTNIETLSVNPIKKIFFDKNKIDNNIEILENVEYDSWDSSNHLEERNNFCQSLINYSKNTNITILSGNINIGALCYFKFGNNKINHIISSGIGSINNNEFNTIIENVNKDNVFTIDTNPKINYNFVEFDNNIFLKNQNWTYLSLNNNNISAIMYYKINNITNYYVIIKNNKIIVNNNSCCSIS